jgi:acetyl-CoA acyltransferase
MQDAYIVQSVRTPGCRRAKGAFKETRPEDLLAHILTAAMEGTANLTVDQVDDIMVGCSFPEAEQGLNIGRICAQMAGFPDAVCGGTVNRFCSSGLEAIAISAMRVMSGWSQVAIGGGVESMSTVPMGGNSINPHPELSAKMPDAYISMGLTAENIATRYEVSREDQDRFACESQMKAAQAQEEGWFTEIVPTPATRFELGDQGTYRKTSFVQNIDDGVRASTTLEGLAALRPVFAAGGSVTAGNSSQTTDGAAATIIASEQMVNASGLKPLAKLKGYAIAGCRSDEMGVGPVYAIPKLLKQTGVALEEIGVFELNEAFAAQALYCIRKLGLDPAKVNPCGGAIALGHPLGCTGAKLCATLLANMRRLGVRYGVESMCMGGGMGAAALFELVD